LLIHFNDIGGRVPPAAPPLKRAPNGPGERDSALGTGRRARPGVTRAAGMNIEFLVTGSEYV